MARRAEPANERVSAANNDDDDDEYRVSSNAYDVDEERCFLAAAAAEWTEQRYAALLSFA